MSKYIDIKELFRRINACHIGNPIAKAFSESDIGNMILDTPTADVEEVVRCKDCIFMEHTFGIGYDMVRCMRTNLNMFNGDGFCSWGIKTDKEKEE